MTAALVAALAVLLVAYVGLTTWERSARRRHGLRGRILAADDSRLGAPTLRSARLGLAARPDHLVRDGRVVIPVEQKPTARRVWPSHQLQVAAQCALVEETTGVRPPHGLVVLAGGVQEQVVFDQGLERRLHQTMAAMRQNLAHRLPPARAGRPPSAAPAASARSAGELRVDHHPPPTSLPKDVADESGAAAASAEDTEATPRGR
jgi:CRISPR-associated exonuclease Cas4